MPSCMRCCEANNPERIGRAEAITEVRSVGTRRPGATPLRTVGPVLDIGNRNPGVYEAQHNSAVPRPHVT